MADNTPPTGGEGSGQNAPPAEPPTKTYTQDDLNALDAKLKREYKAKEAELKKKAEAWDKYQESQKTAEQQAADKAASLEKENLTLKASIELDKARRKYGRKYNIPEADWDRLRGADSKEIEEDAKEWAKIRGLDKTGGPTPQGGSGPVRHPFNQAFLDATGRGGR